MVLEKLLVGTACSTCDCSTSGAPGQPINSDDTSAVPLAADAAGHNFRKAYDYSHYALAGDHP